MDIKDVAGKGLATGRATQQEREFAVSSRVMGEIVVYDQHIPSCFHEKLRDAGRGIWSDVCETRRVVALGHDEDGVIHRALFFKVGYDLGDSGSALADRAIDTEHIFPALVEDGVDGNGGLARLAVAENQLTLAAPDRNERIDDFEASLERHRYGRTFHDGRGRAFDGQSLAGGQRPFAIERPAERVDDASQQSLSNGYIHDPARALDFIARMKMPVFTQQHDADFALVHVERDAEHISRERDQFIKAHAGKPRHLRDAGGDTGNCAHFSWRQLRREGFPHLADSVKHAVENVLEALGFLAHWLFAAGSGSSDLGSALGSGLSFSFSSSSTPFSSDAK